jgi:redox-sensitive bicupin YhaK (pirin superfamily)
MLSVLPSAQRGHTQAGWLDSHHTFSFGEFYNPRQMGFRDLRVINEDRVEPGQGFGTHPHRDMEIISYVLEGALQHKDSMGTGSMIEPGDVQRMSAGSGVLHSEFNASKSEGVHFLQIWIQPEKKGIPPSYEQKHFSEEDRRGRFRLIVSPDAKDGSIAVHQNMSLYSGLLNAGDKVEQALAASRHAWVQVVRGAVRVNGQAVGVGDGVAVSDETKIQVEATESAEVLLFDLA